RSIRVPDYDYSQPGTYFITIVTRGRSSPSGTMYLFGEIKGGEMRLNDAGQIVWEIWNSLPARYPQIALGTAVVMPNHFHGIMIINETPVGVVPVRAIHELPLREQWKQRRIMTLPLLVGYFK